ncbi:MAG TPA: hypothetical protein VN861_19305, partial [Candidatus Acidoferrales bacterium]|nr:hypothetical protein [Candidatus Acidoferrales bacterium]
PEDPNAPDVSARVVLIDEFHHHFAILGPHQFKNLSPTREDFLPDNATRPICLGRQPHDGSGKKGN